MQTRVVVALSLSLILIIGASWSRFMGGGSSDGTLLLVEGRTDSSDHYEKVLQQFLENPAASTTAPQDLTSTDLIGRQMILDYVQMARNGQATELNLGALAEKYVESIPTLNSAPKITYTDLKVVPNDKINFQKYSLEVEKIYMTYASGITSAYSGDGEISLGAESTGISINMRNIYQAAASGLQKLPVPAELAEAHLNLVNVYLENAAAMNSVAKADNDPAKSFAGLIGLKANLEKEEQYISLIREILEDNGV